MQLMDAKQIVLIYKDFDRSVWESIYADRMKIRNFFMFMKVNIKKFKFRKRRVGDAVYQNCWVASHYLKPNKKHNRGHVSTGS